MQIIYADQSPEIFNFHYQNYIYTHQVSLIYHPFIISYFKLIANPRYDKSFVVIENNACAGICYCPIYEEKGSLSISNNGGYTPIPLAQNQRILKEMFKILDEIALSYQCSTIKLYLDSQQHTRFFNHQAYLASEDILMLKKFGYIDTSSIDTVFDLTLSKEQLWGNLRRKYKPSINSYKRKNIEIIKVTHNSPNQELHEQYVYYHHLCSRRKTRSDESFDIQYQMLLEGMASLFVLIYENNPIGFCYFFHCNKQMSYHSGSDNPEYEQSKIPIYHLILWEALQDFSKQGYKTITFGQPSNFTTFQGFNDYCDIKQTNIAFFKRGMGGIPTPLIRGIKYFSHSSLLDDINQFKEQADDNK